MMFVDCSRSVEFSGAKVAEISRHPSLSCLLVGAEEGFGITMGTLQLEKFLLPLAWMLK